MDEVARALVYDNAWGNVGGGGIEEKTHYLAIGPEENKTPISLLHDEHAVELSFPQLYLGQPWKITGSHPSPFAKATSEIHRTDRREVEPTHVLYTAMKVMPWGKFSGIVAMLTSCVFRLAVFRVPTGTALTLGVCGPIVIGGLLPQPSLPFPLLLVPPLLEGTLFFLAERNTRPTHGSAGTQLR